MMKKGNTYVNLKLSSESQKSQLNAIYKKQEYIIQL